MSIRNLKIGSLGIMVFPKSDINLLLLHSGLGIPFKKGGKQQFILSIELYFGNMPYSTRDLVMLYLPGHQYPDIPLHKGDYSFVCFFPGLIVFYILRYCLYQFMWIIISEFPGKSSAQTHFFI